MVVARELAALIGGVVPLGRLRERRDRDHGSRLSRGDVARGGDASGVAAVISGAVVAWSCQPHAEDLRSGRRSSSRMLRKMPTTSSAPAVDRPKRSHFARSESEDDRGPPHHPDRGDPDAPGAGPDHPDPEAPAQAARVGAPRADEGHGRPRCPSRNGRVPWARGASRRSGPAFRWRPCRRVLDVPHLGAIDARGFPLPAVAWGWQS